ncbi:MAG TPA: hypothetical protein VLR49_01590, partial [Ferruginibacter sp.]|nr:hypothetical protein [Ferruginibacter sp.]
MELSQMKISLFLLTLLVNCLFSCAQINKTTTTNKSTLAKSNNVITGAERMAVYLPMLKGKSVAVFANQTSIVGNTHLVDTLIKSGIKVVKI